MKNRIDCKTCRHFSTTAKIATHSCLCGFCQFAYITPDNRLIVESSEPICPYHPIAPKAPGGAAGATVAA